MKDKIAKSTSSIHGPIPYMDRRTFIKAGAAGALLAPSMLQDTVDRTSNRAPKKVIVIGGGIGGLSTGYELMKRGHEVTVLEATGQAGGHVRTVEDGLADGLYADVGAEHFLEPGYKIYRELVDELDLTKLYYPRRENHLYLRNGTFHPKPYTRSQSALRAAEFNERERRFLLHNPSKDIRDLYFKPYIEEFEDEYRPFATGLDHLDTLTVTKLLQEDGASEAAVQRAGGSNSALQAIWHDAILHLRGVPKVPTELWRLKGGNQKLPLALADALGQGLRLGCEVTAIRHGKTGVTVTYKEFGETKKMDGSHAVISVPLPMVGRIEVTPSWSEGKQYVINNTTYYTWTVFMMQSRTKFWKRDGVVPYMTFNQPSISEIRPMAEEVDTPRGLIVGSASGQVAPEKSLQTFRRFYPGESEDIEHIQAKAWPMDRWAPFCERLPFGLGELSKFWPQVMQPEGRIHFASSSTDNLNWGMEAATRSARRIANVIDQELR